MAMQNEAKVHLTALVRAEGTGVGGIGWGKAEKRPTWWLDGIPWEKRGVQQSVPLKDMRRLIVEAHNTLDARKRPTETQLDLPEEQQKEKEIRTATADSSDDIQSEHDTTLPPDSVENDRPVTPERTVALSAQQNTQKSIRNQNSCTAATDLPPMFYTPVSRQSQLNTLKSKPAIRKRRRLVTPESSSEESSPESVVVVQRRRKKAPSKFTPSTYC